MKMDAPAADQAKKSGVAGLWAVTWRSIVYLPITLAVGGTWLIIGLGIIALPVAIAIYAYAHLWKHALVLSGVWVLFFGLWRVLRLAKLWENPPSFL